MSVHNRFKKNPGRGFRNCRGEMLRHAVQSTHQPCCFAKGGNKRKLILSGLQRLSGPLHIFRPCPGKWCLRVRPIKDATWMRMRFRGQGCCSYPCAITVSVLLTKACSHSVSLICVPGLRKLSMLNSRAFSFFVSLTEGCPGLCNSNGRCTLDQNGWHCVCQPGWRGAGCDVAMETLCTDSKDNEGGRRR